MPLTREQIDALKQKKNKPTRRPNKVAEGTPVRSTRLSRIRTNYPRLPEGGPVTWHDTLTPNKSLRCASRGCTAPTPYRYNGVPYCSIHVIIFLSMELMNGHNGNGSHGANPS